MRSADLLIMGLVMMIGGVVVVKLEKVLGELNKSGKVNSVPDTTIAVVIALSGGMMIAIGLLRIYH
jgi:uncharacterized membrane protein YidH (DUF202 family)